MNRAGAGSSSGELRRAGSAGGESGDGARSRPRSASGLARSFGGVATGLKGVGEKTFKGALTGVTAGLGTVADSGRGFREFLLKGPVVELAVAVVVGMAFTDLVNAVVKSFITPLIAAIFRGVSFDGLYFEVNSSRFMYGNAINAIIVFLLVLAFTYWGIMRPLKNFTNVFYPNRAETKDCPRCLSEIPLAATRCRKCCADIEITMEQREEIDRRAAERLFSGKGLCGCAPCFAVGRGAIAASKSVGTLVAQRKSKSKGNIDNGEGDLESGGGDVSKSRGGGDASSSGVRSSGGNGPVMSTIELVVDDNGCMASAASQGGLSRSSFESAQADPIAAAGTDEPAAAPPPPTGQRRRFF